MHLLALTTSFLLWLLSYVEAHLSLWNAQRYQPVSRDLQQLKGSYQNCHINIILFNEDVVLQGAHSPYAVFRIPENYSDFAPIMHGRLALPQMRHMNDHCQATMLVLPSKLTYREILYGSDFFEYEPLVRPDEGQQAGYMLKRRYVFLLANFIDDLWTDPTAGMEVGGNLFVALHYEQDNSTKRTNQKRSADTSIESATVICSHCVRFERNLACSTVFQCLHLVDEALQEMTDHGLGVYWMFVRNEFTTREIEEMERPDPHCDYCTRSGGTRNDQCTLSLKDAMFNYIAGYLNVSHIGFSISLNGRLSKPAISWSGDNAILEGLAAKHTYPLQIYHTLRFTHSR